MHDPYEEIMDVGQPVPVVSWELGSTVASAGDSVSFKGKYYTDKDHTPDHAEVWALVTKAETAAATLKLTPNYSYTKSVSLTDTVRNSILDTYAHSRATWNGHEYELNAKFPTSSTLKSISWGNISTWDQATFDSYYPASFQEEFVSDVIKTLTKDSTYYADLRSVYINYDFTEDQINGVVAKYPQLNTNGELNNLSDLKNRSDIWYVNESKVVGKYYTEVVNGVTIYHEVALDYAGSETLYDVYDSSPWVFSRYDDNVGGTVTAVRSQYMPLFKDLISLIPFTDWIYDTSEKAYAVSFSRAYTLGLTFRVIDTVGNIGRTTDVLSVSLN